MLRQLPVCDPVDVDVFRTKARGVAIGTPRNSGALYVPDHVILIATRSPSRLIRSPNKAMQ